MPSATTSRAVSPFVRTYHVEESTFAPTAETRKTPVAPRACANAAARTG